MGEGGVVSDVEPSLWFVFNFTDDLMLSCVMLICPGAILVLCIK